MTQLWVFILAPLVGGVLAALIHAFFYGNEVEEPPEDPTGAVPAAVDQA